MPSTREPRRGCNQDLTDGLPHPTIQLDVDQLPAQREEVRSVLRAGGAVILVLGEDWLGVLTRQPQLVAGANIAPLIDAGHEDALAGLLSSEEYIGWCARLRDADSSEPSDGVGPAVAAPAPHVATLVRAEDRTGGVAGMYTHRAGRRPARFSGRTLRDVLILGLDAPPWRTFSAHRWSQASRGGGPTNRRPAAAAF